MTDLTSNQIIAVGKALLPYLRDGINSTDLGMASAEAAYALNLTRPSASSLTDDLTRLLKEAAYVLDYLNADPVLVASIRAALGRIA